MTGHELVALRERLRLSQESLARLIDVSFATVNRWERGKSSGPRGPVLAMLRALESAARVHPGLASDLPNWMGRGNNFLWAKVFEFARQSETLQVSRGRT